MRDPRERIKDVLEAISQIERYSALGRARFAEDELIQSWFTRHLQIIGEAARLLPEDIRNLAPEVPWSKMIGMRHILVHDYFRIDTEIVWQVVANELPKLKSSLLTLLKKLEPNS